MEVYDMYNSKLVSSLLKKEHLYPQMEDIKNHGLHLSIKNNQLCLQGTPEDFIDLADLLVSLAISKEAQGQHWHIDELTLMDITSKIPELILVRK